MQNDFSLNARQSSNRAGKTGNNYKFLCNYMTRVLTSAGKTRVVYYETTVVTFNEFTIVLNTGGYWTPTTQMRMNQTSREFGLGFRVFQKARVWFVEYHGDVRPFATEQITLQRAAKSDNK